MAWAGIANVEMPKGPEFIDLAAGDSPVIPLSSSNVSAADYLGSSGAGWAAGSIGGRPAGATSWPKVWVPPLKLDFEKSEDPLEVGGGFGLSGAASYPQASLADIAGAESWNEELCQLALIAAERHSREADLEANLANELGEPLPDADVARITEVLRSREGRLASSLQAVGRSVEEQLLGLDAEVSRLAAELAEESSRRGARRAMEAELAAEEADLQIQRAPLPTCLAGALDLDVQCALVPNSVLQQREAGRRGAESMLNFLDRGTRGLCLQAWRMAVRANFQACTENLISQAGADSSDGLSAFSGARARSAADASFVRVLRLFTQEANSACLRDALRCWRSAAPGAIVSSSVPLARADPGKASLAAPFYAGSLPPTKRLPQTTSGSAGLHAASNGGAERGGRRPDADWIATGSAAADRQTGLPQKSLGGVAASRLAALLHQAESSLASDNPKVAALVKRLGLLLLSELNAASESIQHANEALTRLRDGPESDGSESAGAAREARERDC